MPGFGPPCKRCRRCDKPVPAGRSKFCSAECTKIKDRCLVWPKICIICDGPFMARNPKHLTCSLYCSSKRGNRSGDYHRRKNSIRRSLDKWSDITPQQEAAMRARARKCPLCGVRMTNDQYKPTSKELDHIVPINQGGTHTHGNVRIICGLCNRQRPKDGSDYAGPVTLWAQVPGVVIKTTPKAAPKPQPAPRVAACSDCAAQFEQRSYKQLRCGDCMATLARQAIMLRRDGVPWKEIAQAIGYTVAGAHLLAQRYGLYARY